MLAGTLALITPASAAGSSGPLSPVTDTASKLTSTATGAVSNVAQTAGSITQGVTRNPPPVVTTVTSTAGTAVNQLTGGLPSAPTTPSLPTPTGSPGSGSGSHQGGGSNSSGASSGGGGGGGGPATASPGGSSSSGGPSASSGGSQAGPSGGSSSSSGGGSGSRSGAGIGHTSAGARLASAVAPVLSARTIPARASVATTAGSRDPFTRDIRTIVRVIPLPVKVLIVLLILVAAGFAVRSRFALRRARRLERQRRALVDDLGLLQRALLPDLPDDLPDLDVSVAYRPADGPAAGGDFYDVFSLDDRRTAVIVGDVMGHGREALAVTALMRYSLRAYLNAGLEPRTALKVAGEALEGDPGGELTTVVVAVHDSADGTLTYACAGHEPPIVVGPSAHSPVTACSAPPLGGFMQTGQRQTRISLTPESRVCFFTDGLVEARVDEGLMGRETLETLLGDVAEAETLLDRVAAKAERTPDDMAACIVTAKSSAAEPPTTARVEELELDATEMRSGRLEAFLAACSVADHTITGAVDAARAMVSDGDGALVRVVVERGVASAEVLPRESGPVTLPSLDQARRRARLALPV